MKLTVVTGLALLVAYVHSYPTEPRPQCRTVTRNYGENPALGGSFNFNFQHKGRSRAMIVSNTRAVNYSPRSGARFLLEAENQEVSMRSRFYIMFGKVSIDARVSSHRTVSTVLALQSDVMDEINFKFPAGPDMSLRAVYTSALRRGLDVGSVERIDDLALGDVHTFTIEWRATGIQWLIDGVCVRSLNADSDQSMYPQTPMFLRLSTTSTVSLEEQFEPLCVQAVRVENYSTGVKYTYVNGSTTLDSIVPIRGKIASDGPILRTWFRNALLLTRPC